jgi:zinc transporter ZupT
MEATVSWKGTLWLSFLSFFVSFTLTAAAAYYGSIFLALMAIFSFTAGALFYAIYRAPALLEDDNSSDERRRKEAAQEFWFLIFLVLAAMFFYISIASQFYGAFSNTEVTVIEVLPPSLAMVGLGAFLSEFIKTQSESLQQPKENKDRQ